MVRRGRAANDSGCADSQLRRNSGSGVGMRLRRRRHPCGTVQKTTCFQPMSTEQFTMTHDVLFEALRFRVCSRDASRKRTAKFAFAMLGS